MAILCLAVLSPNYADSVMGNRMKLSILLLSLVFVSLLAAGGYAEPMNVLFIASDDLRNDLGCYGHQEVHSPNIDRLAGRGILFENAYCQQALCNPSRASIMTGRRVDSLRVWDLPTHFRSQFPETITLPQHFQKSGYFTQNVGKIFHNWRQDIEGDPDSWNVPAEMHFNNHNTDKPVFAGELPPNLALHHKCECRDVPDDAYFDGRVANRAIEALEECQQRKQPFFLAVGFWKPHSPFNAPKKYWDLYRRENIRLPNNPSWPIDAPEIAKHDGRELLGIDGERRMLTKESLREIRHGYLAGISYLDAQVGRLLTALERLGLADTTIVVFWSDHGYHLGEHSLYAKTSNFELDARVPLLIAGPGSFAKAKKSSSIVELMDLYPTLSEMCGLAHPSQTEGVSLVPVLNDPQAIVREAALTQHPRPAYYAKNDTVSKPTHMGYSIRTPSHRYTEWREWGSGQTVARELYDHRIDSDETMNLAEQEGHQAVIDKHALLLKNMKPLVSPGWSPQP
jgi:iduronate 2-sulfatase